MRRSVLLLAVTPALALVPFVSAPAAHAATATTVDSTPTQLYWSSGTDPNAATIYTRSAAGTELPFLDGYHPQINPSGTTMVYTSSHGTGEASSPATQATLSTFDLTGSTDGPVTVVPGATGGTVGDIHGYDISDQTMAAPGPVREGSTGGIWTIQRPAGTVVYDHYDGSTCQENTVDADGSNASSGTFTLTTSSCDIEPAWATDDYFRTSTPTIVGPTFFSDRNLLTLVNDLGGGSSQSHSYIHAPEPLSASFGRLPNVCSEACNDSSYDRAVYSTTDAGVRTVHLLETDTDAIPVDFTSTFDAISPVDAWHWSSDSRSLISAASHDGIRGIWRLDPTDPTMQPQLVDGVTATDADWVTRPTPDALIVSSSLPTEIGPTDGPDAFTTSIDNTSSTSYISGARLNVDITVPAGVTADDVQLRDHSTPTPTPIALTLSNGHLTGSYAVADLAPQTTANLPMSITVAGRTPRGTWTTSFGVTGTLETPGTASGAQAHAADPGSGALAQAFIPTQVDGGIPTTTTVAATPGTGTTTTPVTVSAHVASQQLRYIARPHAAGDPTGGQVQFSEDGNPLGSPVTIDASGNAALPAQTLAAGTHSFTATYLGDDGNASQEQAGHVASTSASPATVTITAPANPVPPAAKAPNAPVITGIAPKPGKLLPAWLAPTTGAPVTGYTVTCTRVKGLQVVTVSTTALTATLSGLLNNADYLCEVSAHSAAGDSPQSGLVRARPGKLPQVTLSVVKRAKKGSTVTLKGTATAAGQPMTNRPITLTFRKSTGRTRTPIDSTTTDSKGRFSFKEVLGTSGAYQATMVLGASITADKEKFVRAV